jgi:hypothetical protein
MLAASGARIFFVGDTAYASFFHDVRLRLGPIDLALLPIGAYEPRWFMQSVHMNPAEAVQAHLDLEASESVGMHFGTFQLTTEGIDEPLRALEDACRANNIPRSRFRTLGLENRCAWHSYHVGVLAKNWREDHTGDRPPGWRSSEDLTRLCGGRFCESNLRGFTRLANRAEKSTIGILSKESDET